MVGVGSVPKKRYVERRQILAYLGWLILGFVLLGVYLTPKLLATSEGMLRSGWGGHFGFTPKEGSALFLLYCLSSTPCSEKLFSFSRVNFDLYLLFYTLWAGVGAFLFLKPKVLQLTLRYGQHFATRKEIEPLVETRSKEEIVDSGLPRKGGEAEGGLVGYLGVWMGDSLEAVKAFRREEERGKRGERLFLRLPQRIERIHTMTYAGTGGGKTVGIFRPRIALDAAEGNISIVFDTKYPNPGDSYIDVRDWFRAFGRSVAIIDPFGMEEGPETVQLAVLEGIKDFPSALDAARLIYPPDIEEADPARVFIANARTLLAGILYALATSEEMELSFKEVAHVANMDIGALQNFFKNYPEAKTAIQSTLNADKYVLSGAQNRLVTDLEIFQSDSANRLFQKGPRAVPPAKLLMRPGMIHLVFPERQIRGSAGRAILRFFKRYFDKAILELVEELGGPLPYHVNYYYDELALFGYLPDLDSDLATLRSRNISVHMATQSRAQMRAIYGEKWNATENNNIGTFYLSPGSYTNEEALYWSKMLGKYSMVGTGISENRSPDRKSEGTSLVEKERELITPDEMMTMGVGEMIVLVRGFNPILIKTYPVESPQSPVHWIYERASAYRKEKVLQAAALVFQEPKDTRPTYADRPRDIHHVYRSFEDILISLGQEGYKLTMVNTGRGVYYFLPPGSLEKIGVCEEMKGALLRYHFLAQTPRGLAIPGRTVYGQKRFAKLLDLSGVLVESESYGSSEFFEPIGR